MIGCLTPLFLLWKSCVAWFAIMLCFTFFDLQIVEVFYHSCVCHLQNCLKFIVVELFIGF